MNTISDQELCRLAVEAMHMAYVPYSGYTVGAALLCDDGTIYTGCNIENASYTPTVCAERTAFFKAVSEGKRSFKKIAVCGGKGGTISGSFPPCGVCRQVMSEFCGDSFEILVIQNAEPVMFTAHTLPELLPLRFGPSHLLAPDEIG